MRQPLENLIGQYQKSMYGAAYQICKNAEDANDAVQDTFLKYYTSSEDFADDDHIRAWLLRVTINRAKDLRRTAWRRYLILSREARSMATVPVTEHGALFDAVMALPEKYRIVIHLHYYDDLSIRQIARILSISEGSVKMRLSRARTLLKNTTEEERI